VAADSLGERRIALAVNTHGHDDHTWGNQIVASGTTSPPILAHAATSAYMQARIGQMRDVFSRGPSIAKAAEDSLTRGAEISDSMRGRLGTRAARIRQNLIVHADLVVTPPSVSITTDTVIVVGGTRVIIRSIGAAHSAGDVAVVVPAAGIIAAGDLALVDDLPGLDATSGDLTNWIAALVALGSEGSRTSVRWIVPGHGPIGDLGTLRTTAEYLRVLRDSVSTALANGLDLEATRTRARRTTVLPRPADMERHLQNVESAWLLLRRALPR
jgi:glyoxylase-like metal-dependent hydrolase (beta-lactamase superfamily II)